jgi:hypothetical protein
LSGSLATPASDVYSVGVLLFYLVTGHYPIQADTLDALRAEHAKGERRHVRPKRPEVSREFARVIERALVGDPRDRYADGAALASAVQAVIRRKDKTMASRLFGLAYGAIFVGALVTALGALSTAELNLVLERADFSSETVWDWLVWGVQSSVLPAFLLATGAAGMGLAGVIWRMSISRSSVAADLDRRIRRQVSEWVHKRPSEVCSGCSALLLVLSLGILAGAWWYFSWMMSAFNARVSTSPPELLAAFAPDREPDHNLFRMVFSLIVWGLSILWYAMVKFAGRLAQRVSRNVLAGGVAVIVLALTTNVLSYQLFRYNEFEVTSWNGQRCYLLGERADDFLISCPELPPPRNRILKRDAGVERRGVLENIFTHFSRTAYPTGGAPVPATTR